jgi:di/tricarboxylate transporter
MESEADTDALIAGLIRDGERHMAPMGLERICVGDVLIVEADPAAITELQQSAQLKLSGEKPLQGGALESDEIKIAEGVVMYDSVFRGHSIASLRLRSIYGVNLLAVARSGERLQARLGHNRLRPGDVLWLQGPVQGLKRVFTELGCLPLAERGISLARKPQIILATAVFVLAVAASAAGIMSVHIAFAAAVLAMIFSGLVSLEDAYTSINWPIVVLLGAMIPVGQALETTGGAQLIAEQLKFIGAGLPEPVTVGLILVVTMCLSDVVNNAATAVLMCPIVIEVAQSLQVSPDTLLMTVAIGSSCAFLTPVGHQSNTLVMGPGGYRFSDYWRLGLPVQIIVIAAAIPLVLHFWPLR